MPLLFVVAGGLPMRAVGCLRILQIFVDLACCRDHRQIEPSGGKAERQFIGKAELRGLRATRLRIVARMIKAEITPTTAEQPPHDGCADFWMPLPFWPIHVWLAKVAYVVQKESEPQPDVPRKSVKASPCACHEKG